MQNAFVPISTVTPVYAGASFLPQLVAKLATLKSSWETTSAPVRLTESIFVIDSAIDHSEQVLKDLARQYPWVKVLTLSRNFGQHPATMAGISYSSGEWVVTLDEDCQHDPVHIPAMLTYAVEKHLDVVYAKPAEAVHQSLVRDFGSRSYKKLMSRLTNNPFITHFNSFRLMRGVVARAAASVSSHETYYDVAVVWYTNRIDSLTFDLKDKRFIESGKSGYTFRKLVSHARRMLVTSSTKHLRVGALTGLIALALCSGFALWTGIQKVLTPAAIQVQGWTSLFIAILLLGGVTLLLLSIIIEYLTIVLLHSQGKPVFFVIDRDSDDLIAPYLASAGVSRARP